MYYKGTETKDFVQLTPKPETPLFKKLLFFQKHLTVHFTRKLKFRKTKI